MSGIFDPNHGAGWPASAFVIARRPLLLLYRGPDVTVGHVENAERAIFAFDLEARRAQRLLVPARTIERFLVAEDATRFAAAAISGDVHVWDSQTLAPLGTWTPLRKRDVGGDFLPQVLLSPDGNYLVAVRTQPNSILPESIVRFALDRPSPARIARSDSIDLSSIRRFMHVAKVEPDAKGVWLAHEREPGLVRMRFGDDKTRTVLRKHPVRRWMSIPRNGIVFADAPFDGAWRSAELVTGAGAHGPRRVTRLRTPPGLTMAWSASPDGELLASLDEEGELVVRTTRPVRRLFRTLVPNAENVYVTFHDSHAIANDGTTWVRTSAGVVQCVMPNGGLGDAFAISVA